MVEIKERGPGRSLGRSDREDIATYQSQTGTFHRGEDGVSWEVRDGLETGSFVLAPDSDMHRNTTGPLS